MSDQIETAANLMVRDYLILAFLVSLGSLQIAVSISGIRGLWLLPKRMPTRVFGFALIALGLAYYIFSPMWIEGPWAAGSVIDGTSDDRIWGTASLGEISGARNINDIHGGMAGTAYAVLFIASAVAATLFAAIIGAINLRMSRDSIPLPNSPSFRRGPRGGDDAVIPPSFRRGPEGGDDAVIPPSFGRGPGGGDDAVIPPSFRRGLGGGRAEVPDGLDALKNNDPITTLKSSLSNLRKNGRKDAQDEMRSTHRWSIPSMIGRMWRN